MDHSSDSESVLLVSSEPRGDGARVFTVLRPEPGETFPLPSDLATEADLVRAMGGAGLSADHGRRWEPDRRDPSLLLQEGERAVRSAP